MNKSILEINVRVSWNTIIRSAFMRIFCREIYDKFAKNFEVSESDVEVTQKG